ncbi:MAG: PcfJ domain-containing protein, partial [Deltaproteobacteria bacterium]|nr:PcfJ domain-containing protein [Deltaproteobacteria bacterium]
GKRMEHCVSGYAQRCMSGGSVILSIRKEGESIATIELVRDGSGEIELPNGHRYRVGQFYGRGNSEPSKEARVVWGMYVEALKRKEVEKAKSNTVRGGFNLDEFSPFERRTGIPLEFEPDVGVRHYLKYKLWDKRRGGWFHVIGSIDLKKILSVRARS